MSDTELLRDGRLMRLEVEADPIAGELLFAPFIPPRIVIYEPDGSIAHSWTLEELDPAEESPRMDALRRELTKSLGPHSLYKLDGVLYIKPLF